MASLNGTISLNTALRYEGSNPYGGPRFDSALALSHSIGAGVGANQADVFYQSEHTISSGGSLAIDLTSDLDAAGVAMAMVELVGVVVFNRSIAGTDNSTSLTVGGGTHPVISSITVNPGGILYMLAPDASGLAAVADGSTDKLNIVNGAGAAATVQVVLIGRRT
mgnify:CR=1 FL=1